DRYGVTLIFTLMSPLMSKADQYAADADPKGIERINYLAMGLLGLIFGIVVTLFFIGGATMGQAVVDAIPAWLSAGLSAAGGMMRFVGFAILLKFMMNRDMWGFYFLGFGMALIVSGIPTLATPALLILALIGFGFAYWDYQQNTELKGAVISDGGDEDGI
ncbi:PTS sugar transporter subunit IIC, partial [uncultured Olegusella sp.]|uniref:PTS sugar transporter subunit IIC n=1 Tax=uncultured Olegusella sp. TaxID=1979846 RepID=UPI00261C7B2D